MPLLLITNDLHTLIAQLAARQQIVRIDNPLAKTVNFFKDIPRVVVLEADLSGRYRFRGQPCA